MFWPPKVGHRFKSSTIPDVRHCGNFCGNVNSLPCDMQSNLVFRESYLPRSTLLRLVTNPKDSFYVDATFCWKWIGKYFELFPKIGVRFVYHLYICMIKQLKIKILLWRHTRILMVNWLIKWWVDLFSFYWQSRNYELVKILFNTDHKFENERCL